MAHKATIGLGLSDCIEINGKPIEDPNQGDVREIVIFLPEGGWVQFVYNELTTQDGDIFGISMDPDGFWHTHDDKLRWSDLTIHIEETPEIKGLFTGLSRSEILALGGADEPDA